MCADASITLMDMEKNTKTHNTDSYDEGYEGI